MTSWTVSHAQFSQVSASWTTLQDGLIFPREAGPLDLHVKTLPKNQFATLIRSRSPPLGVSGRGPHNGLCVVWGGLSSRNNPLAFGQS